MQVRESLGEEERKMIRDVIQTVVERIKKYRPLYEQSEMAVRE